MFFGLCNSPTTFQAYMNHTFLDFIDEGWLIIYMDDMLIHSEDNPALHQERTKRVLQHLCEQRLALKLSKCSFDASEVKYLGLLVSAGAIKMDPTKLLAIKNWNPPQRRKSSPILHRILQFLLKIHPGILGPSQTATLPHPQKCPMAMVCGPRNRLRKDKNGVP